MPVTAYAQKSAPKAGKEQPAKPAKGGEINLDEPEAPAESPGDGAAALAGVAEPTAKRERE
jgi:hypothetical protein